MKKFESSIKQVPYPQEAVYRNISDLSNLERVRDRVPQDKLKEFSFDQDSVTVSVDPVGKVTLRIVDREEPKCVKFETTQSPMPFNLWIQVLEDEGDGAGRHPLHAGRHGERPYPGRRREDCRRTGTDTV